MSEPNHIELSRRQQRLFGTCYRVLHLADIDTGPAFMRLVAEQRCANRQVPSLDYLHNLGMAVSDVLRRARQEHFVAVAAQVLAYEMQQQIGIPVEPTQEVTYPPPSV